MEIREVTPGMDDEDRNVMHNQNALTYYSHGMEAEAAAEVALDAGFCGTFEEWKVRAEQTLNARAAQEKVNAATADMWH